MAKLKLWLRDTHGNVLADFQWPPMLADPMLSALRDGGTVELYEMDSGATLALASVAAEANHREQAAIERAFPGSGDPGDPGLGRPSTVETDGPAGPSEG